MDTRPAAEGAGIPLPLLQRGEDAHAIPRAAEICINSAPRRSLLQGARCP